MNAPQVVTTPGRANLALATLFVGMFVMGGTELLVVGMLDLIAADLRVSIPAAGTLVTAYALGLAIGGPILTAVTIRLNRRTVLLGALALFVLSNLVVVLTASYATFVAVRTVTGALEGLFLAAAFAAGTAAVPPARAGRAMAVVISGAAVSGALGAPLGALLGHALGWRGAFTAAIGVAVAALIATLALVPSAPSAAGGAIRQARYAFAPRVLVVLGLTVLVFAAVYAPLTYIVPILQTVTGVSGALITVFLLAYGVATAVGSFGGGRFADANAARALTVGTIGVAACLVTLYVAGASAVAVAIAVLGLGLFAMGMAPSMQYRVVSLAGPGSELAQSLPASAAGLGTALGSFAGGVAIGGYTPRAAVITGLAIALIGIPTAWAAGYLRPPAHQKDTRPAPAELPASHA